jgi:hypothetical protein
LLKLHGSVDVENAFGKLRLSVLVQINSPKQAASEFATALNLTHNVKYGLVQTSILASNKHYHEAHNHLDKIDKILAQPPKKNKIEDLRLPLNC